MKRHESIVPLSHDHHTGLLFCWKLRQGIRKQVPVARMLPYISYFHAQHLAPHFMEEEQLLFADGVDELCLQALKEHDDIRQALSAVGDAATDVGVTALADMVDNHIRFEERVLFPHLEQKLTAQQLAAIGAQLQESHQLSHTDDYEDEFWK